MQKIGKLKPGKLWSFLNEGPLSAQELYQNRYNFKSSSTNYSLSMYDPETNGKRYYAAVIYLMAKALSSESWEKLKRTKKRALCDPMGIEIEGEFVCLDYLRAIYEMEVLCQVEMDNKSLLEIGAGYGRTCHSIISNYDVKSYTIVDLGSCLELSKAYLKEVLNEVQYRKIIFVNIERDYLEEDYDLCISIDAFSEIPQDDVETYLNYINSHCRWFYINIPIGKYEGEMHTKNKTTGKTTSIENIVLNKCFESVKIDKESSILSQVPKFVEIFTPGKEWSCEHISNSKPFMQYWQALYKRKKDDKCGKSQQLTKNLVRKSLSADTGS